MIRQRLNQDQVLNPELSLQLPLLWFNSFSFSLQAIPIIAQGLFLVLCSELMPGGT